MLNFVSFMPRKNHVIMSIKLPKQRDFDGMLEESGVELLAYDAQFRQYRVRINPTLDDKQRRTLSALAQQARAGFGKAA